MYRLHENQFGSKLEAIVYPLLLLVVLWMVQVTMHETNWNFVRYGILPRTPEGLKGIFFMPFIHSPSDWNHLINNSFPIAILTSIVIYFYRDIARKVLIYSWLLTGAAVWLFAESTTAYHIGISGVIYALVAFVFFSGYLRKYLPLQALALFVVFLYGSMIWGIFPTEERISWEGHLAGLLVGLFLAWAYVKRGPEVPKYQYEIEKELGIEPPDYEGIYWEKVRAMEEMKWQQQEAKRKEEKANSTVRIVYHLKSNDHPDENAQ
ncbi:MAG: rhomboid family intramembrane serine protease [Crocinitomicaceae bacterium]|nr:rhomboid family intramembrane serine protease [Crocinitomicaceae bacterium]